MYSFKLLSFMNIYINESHISEHLLKLHRKKRTEFCIIKNSQKLYHYEVRVFEMSVRCAIFVLAPLLWCLIGDRQLT